MTPEQYYKLRKHYELLQEAKRLAKYDANKTANMIKFIAFKQEAGMMPKKYIEKFEDSWKD